jgi:diacylglycerol kinase family enzyme
VREPAAILLNRAAATARNPRVTRAVALTRAALDADVHVADTRNADELGAWMAERVPGYATVVVAGGDGSLSVAYNVLAGRSDVTLGYIPAGFGNATANLLDMPSRPEWLAAVIARGDARPVDLVEVNGRLALFAGAGWDAVVAERYHAAGARRLLGWAGAIARSVPDLLHRPEVSVTADGTVVHEGPMELLVAGTTPWYGRGLLVNPGARPDRGELTLRVYRGPLPRFAMDAARWVARRTPSPPAIGAREVVVRTAAGEPLTVQADGDVVGSQPEWRISIRPAAVRLIGRW